MYIQPSTTNLQGHWRLDGNYTDISANGYSLSDSGHAGTDATGMFGGAKKFASASSQYATIAEASCANLKISGSQTWLMWFKPTTTATAMKIFGFNNSANTANRGIQVVNVFKPWFEITGLTTNTKVEADNSLTAGNWYCIIGVYDSSASKLKLWVNGVKKEVTASGSASAITSDFSIGRMGSYNGVYTNGTIDECAVYNRAWSDDEVAGYYQKIFFNPQIIMNFA